MIVYDLSRLSGILPDHHRDFAKKIKRWMDAHSVSADLKLASDYLDRLLRMHLAQESASDLIKMALMHSAILAYARADERKSKIRGKLTLKGKMNTEQVAFHELLIELRDDAVGHFGRAGIAKPWNEDRVLLVQEGEHWQPVATARRALFERDFVKAFLLHLQSLEPITVEIVEHRRNEFQAMLNERAAEREVAGLLESCILSAEDLKEFEGPVLGGTREGRVITVAATG